MAFLMKAFFEPVVPEMPWPNAGQFAEVWLVDDESGIPNTHVSDVFKTGILSDSDHQRLAEMLAASGVFFKLLHEIYPSLEGEMRSKTAEALALVRPRDLSDDSLERQHAEVDQIIRAMLHEVGL